MDGKKSKTKAPIIVAGIAAIVCSTVLTGIGTYNVINKANRDADFAYAQTVDQYRRMLADKQKTESEDSKSDSSVVTSTGETVVTTYTSDDLIQIEGEWYVLSDLLDDDKNQGNGIPIRVDVNTTVSVNESQYAHILNQEDVEAIVKDEIPFYGNEYVVVDIDGSMVYLVKKGDTLSTVSGLIGYSVQELAEHNLIKNVNLIYEGQTLRVPASQEAIEYMKSKAETNTVEEDANTETELQNVSDSESSIDKDVVDSNENEDSENAIVTNESVSETLNVTNE